MRARHAALALALALVLAGCRPELGEPLSRIDAPRVLAVRGEPPEALPGQAVRLSVLVATPPGINAPPPAWALCTSARPLGERGAVAAACLGAAAELGAGDAMDTVLPREVCKIFGPDTQSAMLRPPDPDVTGGYYQPVRVDLGGVVSFGFERIRCELANAPIEVEREYQLRYHANQNPELLPLEITGASLDQVHAGADLALRASWPETAREPYPAMDPRTGVLTDHRESLRVSWYASAGELDEAHTGRAESDPATSTDNAWHAPAEPGPVRLWVVLRDSRGGVAFSSHEVQVVP
jgi:hypothetical protein